jgi:dihydrofolate synthase/folylpolyglutamate synthase
MTYDEALSLWHGGRINYEVRAAKPGDLKLERMRALLKLLGDPHDCVRLVHVTGTKGKGSTCAMIAAVLGAAGYRVGLFTSPHLEHVEERIQVDRVPISHAEIAARMSEVAPAVRELEAHGTPITFFEIGAALGFLHFYYRRCDLAVIEVGLGGRFDSTNVCRPLVSVITNVGLDHTAQLGTTLEAIAYQKAGIIKRRVPVVSGVTQPGPRAVVYTVAAELTAPLFWSCDDQGRPARDIPRTRLLGGHQAANAAVAVAAIERLRAAGISIPAAAVTRGLATVEWPARIEVISRRPAVVLDTAHNVPSTEALIHTLDEEFPLAEVQTKRVIFAVSADKNYREMIRVLARYFNHFHMTRYANPRGVAPGQLAATLAEIAPARTSTIHAESKEAWSAASSATGTGDLVCVTGSVFLAGELRSSMCRD